eukprot:SAG31_NODE_30_length_32545_cov_9.378999_12_plen_468_part_00
MDQVSDFQCPITCDIMADPVICADGHSYERKAIAAWLQNHRTSPRTGLPLEDTKLVPNHALRGAIEGWRQAQEMAMREIPVDHLPSHPKKRSFCSNGSGSSGSSGSSTVKPRKVSRQGKPSTTVGKKQRRSVGANASDACDGRENSRWQVEGRAPARAGAATVGVAGVAGRPRIPQQGDRVLCLFDTDAGPEWEEGNVAWVSAPGHQFKASYDGDIWPEVVKTSDLGQQWKYAGEWPAKRAKVTVAPRAPVPEPAPAAAAAAAAAAGSGAVELFTRKELSRTLGGSAVGFCATKCEKIFYVAFHSAMNPAANSRDGPIFDIGSGETRRGWARKIAATAVGTGAATAAAAPSLPFPLFTCDPSRCVKCGGKDGGPAWQYRGHVRARPGGWTRFCTGTDTPCGGSGGGQSCKQCERVLKRQRLSAGHVLRPKQPATSFIETDWVEPSGDSGGDVPDAGLWHRFGSTRYR